MLVAVINEAGNIECSSVSSTTVDRFQLVDDTHIVYTLDGGITRENREDFAVLGLTITLGLMRAMGVTSRYSMFQIAALHFF